MSYYSNLMIIKNLKSLLHRYPVAVLLYFTGLVGAFVAFELIILQADPTY